MLYMHSYNNAYLHKYNKTQYIHICIKKSDFYNRDVQGSIFLLWGGLGGVGYNFFVGGAGRSKNPWAGRGKNPWVGRGKNTWAGLRAGWGKGRTLPELGIFGAGQKK